MEVLPGRIHVGEDAPADVPRYETVRDFLSDLSAAGEADVALQAFDARYVAGESHLRSAVWHADRSIRRGENVADRRAVEILLYAAGRRQIDQAMRLGIGEGTTPVLVLIAGVPEENARDGTEDGAAVDAVANRVRPLLGAYDAWESADPDRIASVFDVTDAERAATDAPLEELVRERVALLDVEK
ncbi:MAG: KEOPS complex subunit Cgi121 [Halanaeroarchaeum sp.]